jgi:hypothetical protein
VTENVVQPNSNINPFTQAENIARVVQTTLAAVVGVGALLTANGFIIVNSYLAKFTDIQGYNIAPSQYIAAGACPVVLVYQILLIFLCYFIWKLVNKSQNRNFSATLSRLQFTILPIIAALAFSYLYGSSEMYGTIPRAIGGGTPGTIVLIFDKAETLQTLGLTSDPLQPHQTKTLVLLAELTDGILVADTNNGHVVTVKYDFITARLDDQVDTSIITPTPTFTPSPTPVT